MEVTKRIKSKSI